MATPLEIIASGMARSARFNNQQLALADELVDVVRRQVRAAFAVAARINPFYYLSEETVAFDTDHWPWPDDVEAFVRLEITATGTEVVVVPFDDRQAETVRAAVYARGAQFRSAGNPLDPTSGDLTMFYTPRPVDPATGSDPIDARFPEAYLDLFYNDIALYLAVKTGRADDIATFTTERDRWLMLYIAHLEHVLGVVEVRRKQLVRRFAANTLVSVYTGAA